ncbi:HNH endonuclease domain-containing protein [Idiomarina seosinensis]|uniref:HNH nuclease domain-containing protein n=1 Tax=Idiomarina seosinensis TaxID=281739 RepID=A0A432ZBL7_9GAMM|nr:HNH endonuclease domain-containing protein [Idiomarina seosinensis]RUO75335.1 hypothetical protein CWI81_10200 [Idiomarina seosinensis]
MMSLEHSLRQLVQRYQPVDAGKESYLGESAAGYNVGSSQIASSNIIRDPLDRFPSHELFHFLSDQRQQLKTDDFLFIAQNFGQSANNNIDQGPLARLKLLCSRLGLSSVESNITEHYWILVLRKRAWAAQPLDRIESVLRHDKKTATYKLALLRAFCDIAEQGHDSMYWYADGRAGVSLNRLAECWLEYYWPLLVHDIAQIRGNVNLKFEKGLRLLIQEAAELYRLPAESINLLSVFLTQREQDRLPESLANRYSRVIKEISQTIIRGPVDYTKGELFEYDQAQQKIMVDGDLWQEFCLSGYWVRDSLLVRWAELSASLAAVGVPTPVQKAHVFGVLLESSNVARDQSVASKYYKQQSNLCCVWTDEQISAKTLAVDHVLPFSLWFSNDLWNLQPSFKAVNSRKGDKVPLPELLQQRKDPLLDNWRYLYECEPTQFKSEVTRTIGRFEQRNWREQLFSHLLQTAEIAVNARQLPAWEG